MNVIETELPGVLIVEPNLFGDARGFLTGRAGNGAPLRGVCTSESFAQEEPLLRPWNHGAPRGLDFQNRKPRASDTFVLIGQVFDVAVDITLGSGGGKWTGATFLPRTKASSGCRRLRRWLR